MGVERFREACYHTVMSTHSDTVVDHALGPLRKGGVARSVTVALAFAATSAVLARTMRNGKAVEGPRATSNKDAHRRPAVSAEPSQPAAPSLDRPRIPEGILARRETGPETAARVRRLLRLRSRIDRTAWNTLGYGPLGSLAMPGIADWDDRCMLLVSIGMAFEDMPEVLDHALKDAGTSSHEELLSRALQAYEILGIARVPARWNYDAMENAWRDLCDAVAGIVGLEPAYGTKLPDQKAVR
jgi:hypothetical protein